MRPILALVLAVLLAALIYSQRDMFWEKVKDEVDARRGPDTASGAAALAEARFRDGVRAYEANDLAAAEAAFREALAHNPGNVDACDHLGLVLSRQGRREAAREVFLQRVALDSASVGAWVNLVTTCAHLGRWDEALQHLGRAEALEPDNPRLKGLRSVLEKREGMPETF